MALSITQLQLVSTTHFGGGGNSGGGVLIAQEFEEFEACIQANHI